MKKNRNTLYATATLFIFLIGIMLGWQFSDSSLEESQITFKKSELDLKSFSLQFENQEFFNVGDCSTFFLDEVQEEIYESAIKLDTLEKQGRVDDENYDFLKRLHNVNQVLFYLNYQKFSNQCSNTSSNVILFFFNSSEPEKVNLQGEVLDELVGRKDIIVLPMDYKYTEEINFFYEFYEVSELPSLIINYETILTGHQTMRDIGENLK